MKIVTFHYKSSPIPTSRLGILEGHKIIDCNLAVKVAYQNLGYYSVEQKANSFMPPSLHELLTKSLDPISDLHRVHDLSGIYQGKLYRGDFAFETTLDQVQLLAPLDKISSYKDFYAHKGHVETGFKKRGEEIPKAWFEIPAYYKGSTYGFIGHEEKIIWPKYSDKLDFELELGVVLGKGGKNILSNKAYEHIFGFTILNDISARDIQKKEMSIRLGPAKGKDFCSVMGPVIVTADEFDGEPNFDMSVKVNGELWGQGRSGDAHYSFSQMIEHTSQDEWVAPGDFLGSGTLTTGCGLELDKWIAPGDIIEMEASHIGVLKNEVGTKEYF